MVICTALLSSSSNCSSWPTSLAWAAMCRSVVSFTLSRMLAHAVFWALCQRGLPLTHRTGSPTKSRCKRVAALLLSSTLLPKSYLYHSAASPNHSTAAPQQQCTVGPQGGPVRVSERPAYALFKALLARVWLCCTCWCSGWLQLVQLSVGHSCPTTCCRHASGALAGLTSRTHTCTTLG